MVIHMFCITCFSLVSTCMEYKHLSHKLPLKKILQCIPEIVHTINRRSGNSKSSVDQL